MASAFYCLCLLLILSSSSSLAFSLHLSKKGSLSIHTLAQPNPIRPVTFLNAERLRSEEASVALQEQIKPVAQFLFKAGLVGTLTGLSVVVFKSAIAFCSHLFYEDLANILPKPSFYWPLALYPLIGSSVVSLLVAWKGDQLRKGIDSIAKSIDAEEERVFVFPFGNLDNDEQTSPMNVLPSSLQRRGNPDSIEIAVGLAPAVSYGDFNLQSSTEAATSTLLISTIAAEDVSVPSSSTANPLPAMAVKKKPKPFNPANQALRLCGAVATLGSGCSLGPEGPAVEIGAGWGRVFSGSQASQQERHHLFLAGTAAGVAAGFNAPISGVFFAIECGNRYLSKNTIKLDENAPDGPRADIAAIVIAAALADIVCGLGLQENSALSIQGNSYAMSSPFFELPMYMGLGLVCGTIAASFTSLRDAFTELFAGMSWGSKYPLASLPKPLHPLIGGAVCGVVSVFWPQTLFVGYATLDQLLAGKIQLALPLLFQLLGLKLFLSSFSLGSGLIGGVFAPSLFFGAAAGTAYHNILSAIIDAINHWAVARNIVSDVVVDGVDTALSAASSTISILPTDVSFFTIANAPAYATVGAAATLGALFRAPLTSSMLMFELTQNHDIVLPVLVSTGLGGLFAEILSRSRRLW